MAASENSEPDDLVHIEDVSRKTTIGGILKIAANRLHFLGFPKMNLKIGLLQRTSKEPLGCDVAAPSPQAVFPPQGGLHTAKTSSSAGSHCL